MRDAALVVLYRLLFILYAEGRRFLPAGDPRYDAVSLRRLGDDISVRRDRGEPFSATAVRYWTAFGRLCRAIDAGDPAIGLAPRGGGLFEVQRTPLLAQISLSDAVMADVVDALSFEATLDGRTAIDYRDLSVQQLGGIYEQLLELELVREGAAIMVRPDISARRTSGSYYTPDDLVALIIRETVGPLVAEKVEAFRSKAEEVAQGPLTRSRPEGDCLAALRRLDPAVRLLELKICDPAMGAGHFLVSLVDFLADHAIAAMADAESRAVWCGYVSPLRVRIEQVRHAVIHEAGEQGFAIDPARLDDGHIVRRMAAARCVYGVDKNQMAVELAKVALRLHTFIPGAPLYLDHHLRCGDSLFGLSVRSGVAKAAALGAPLLLQEPVARAVDAVDAMQVIDALNDAGIAAVRRPAGVFAEVQAMTAPLDALLSLLQAFDWLGVNEEDKAALLEVDAPRFAGLLHRAKQLIAEERFFNWEVAFPDMWPGPGESNPAAGGFDAVIGNPPWDRMKLQQVEWFAARRRDIAFVPRAADRARMIAALTASGDPLACDYARASARAGTAARVAQASGDYPLLSGGDVNLYSLFVERAMALVKPRGLVGLLTPSGIASDKTAAPFFQGVATRGRLKALYDFENRRRRFGKEPFFPDVDSRFKFCVFVASPAPRTTPALCASFLQDVSELADAERCFPLTAENFARVNPNTGTAPVFRTRRDADLTMGIYRRLPVLVDRAAEHILPPPPLAGEGGGGGGGAPQPLALSLPPGPFPGPPPQAGEGKGPRLMHRMSETRP